MKISFDTKYAIPSHSCNSKNMFYSRFLINYIK